MTDALTRAADDWRPIASAPTEECEPFLVLTHEYGGKEPVVIQVSRYEGRLYPDAFGAAINWEDAVTAATHWMPRMALPKPPPTFDYQKPTTGETGNA